MKVKLVAITQPIVDGIRTAEELIVYCARVSNPNNQLNTLTGPKLLAYCFREGHVSIFEQADLTVEIQTSRAISAQIIRHWSFRFQEFSQRYSVVQEAEKIELRKQASSNRQSSTEVIDDYRVHLVNNAIHNAFNLYDELVESGVARECARMILPLASRTTLYMKGSVRSWMHYLMVRTKRSTQKEHRMVAEAVYDIFKEQFPIISEAISILCEKES